MNLLQTTCPQLAEDLIADYQKRKSLPNEEGNTKDGVRLCCGKNQLLATQSGFVLPESLLGRCPTCLENFQRTFCNLACSPGRIVCYWFVALDSVIRIHSNICQRDLDAY